MPKTIDITLASPAVALVIEKAITQSLSGLLNAEEIRTAVAARDAIKAARLRVEYREATFGLGRRVQP
jgi:hypothetical protein